MKKATFLIIFLAVISFSTGFEAEIVESNNQANESQNAEYVVEVRNNATEARTYSISSQGHSGVYLPSPARVDAEAQENNTFQFSVSPETNQREGNYRFQIFLRDRTTDQVEELRPRLEVSYDFPLDFTSINFDKNSYEPGDTLEVDTSVINLDSSTLNDYKVEKTFLNQTETTQGLEIRPEAERNYQETFEIPENQFPSNQTLEVILEKDNSTKTLERNIEIDPHENLTQDTERDSRILYKLETTNIQNTGTTELEHTIEKTVPNHLTPITTFSEEPDESEQGEDQTSYRWVVELQQEESAQITQNTRYWIPTTALLAIIALIAGIKQKISKIKINRTVTREQDSVKIHLEIINKSSQTFNNLEVVEFISDIAEIKREFPMAKPEIRKKREGTQLKWSLKTLEPGDQHIFEYKIKPKVEVEGGITLNPTKLLNSEGKTLSKGKEQDTEASK